MEYEDDSVPAYQNYIEGLSDLPLDLPLHPQDFVYQYTKDQILNMNLVLNYQFRTGSNIYIVYSVYRDVIGYQIDDFAEFIHYTPNELQMAETNFTQSLFVKLDYWFDY